MKKEKIDLMELTHSDLIEIIYQLEKDKMYQQLELQEHRIKLKKIGLIITQQVDLAIIAEDIYTEIKDFFECPEIGVLQL